MSIALYHTSIKKVNSEQFVPNSLFWNLMLYYDNVNNTFRKRLKEMRLERGLTKKQLALALFVSERLISYWENGERECDFDMLIKIAEFFEVSIDYLLGQANI